MVATASAEEEWGEEFYQRCCVLGMLWKNHRSDPKWLTFAEDNDSGLPLAALIADGSIKEFGITSSGRAYVDETWTAFCAITGISPTVSVDELSEILEYDSPL